MRNQKFKVGVVGATGLVGGEILNVLEQRNFPVEELFLFASERSEGEKIKFQSKEYKVRALRPGAFDSLGLDFVLFGTSAGLSAEYCPEAADQGAIVIDNSSHFRLDNDVPLVVPEVNPEEVERSKELGIIANPNCSTIQMVVCLKALQDKVPLKRVVVSTYQSVSGAGTNAMEELRTQIGDLFRGQPAKAEAFPHQIAFNCIPHIDVFLEDGSTKEEMKMIQESRKILKLPELKITATAVRVPTFISHAESINIEFESAMSVSEARLALENMEGVVVLDEPEKTVYPTPTATADQDLIYVGRIRKDVSAEHALNLWVVADNLRKGAATNAVQIAEICMRRKFSRAAA